MGVIILSVLIIIFEALIIAKILTDSVSKIMDDCIENICCHVEDFIKEIEHELRNN